MSQMYYGSLGLESHTGMYDYYCRKPEKNLIRSFVGYFEQKVRFSSLIREVSKVVRVLITLLWLV